MAFLFLLFMSGDLLHYYIRGSLADQAFTRSKDFRDLPPILPTFMQEPMAEPWEVRDPSRIDGGLFGNLPIKNSVWQDDEFNPTIFEREFLALGETERQAATVTGLAALAAEDPPAPGSALLPLSAEGLATSISQWGYNNMSLEVSAPKDGLLVTAIAYDPGWTVTIDGAPVETRRANVKFLAFPVTQGAHSVAMTFEPLSRSLHPVARYGTILAMMILTWLALGKGGRTKRMLHSSPA